MQKTKGLVKRLLALGLSVTTIATSISTGYVPAYAKAATVTQEETKTDSTDATNEKEPKVATISFSEDALLQKAVDNAGFTIDVTTGKVKAAAIRYNNRLLSIGVDYTAKAVKTAQQEASDRTTYTYDVIIEGQGAYSGAYTRHSVTQVQKKEVAATSKTATSSDAAKGTVKRVANKKGDTNYSESDWHVTWNSNLPTTIDDQGNSIPIFVLYSGKLVEPGSLDSDYGDAIQSVSIGGKTLTRGSEYRVTSWKDNSEAGTGMLTLELTPSYMKNNHVSAVAGKAYFKIINSASVDYVISISKSTGGNKYPINFTDNVGEPTGGFEEEYIGENQEVKPTITITEKNGAGYAGTYSTVYSNDTAVGTGKITLTMPALRGNEVLEINYPIVPRAIKASDVTTSGSYTYNGNPQTPTVSVGSLSAGTDYTVSASNNINAGTATVTVTGKGNYKGEVSKTFPIAKKTVVDGTDVGITVDNAVYDGTQKRPNVTVVDKLQGVTLTQGSDYTLSYGTNIAQGAGTGSVTVNFNKNFTGSITKNFDIGQGNITGKTVLLDKQATASADYDPRYATPAERLSLEGVPSTGYDVSVTSLTGATWPNAGGYTAKFVGKGAYTGTVQKDITINKIQLSNSDVVASGQKIDDDNTPSVTLVYRGETLVASADYTLTIQGEPSSQQGANIVVTAKPDSKNYTGSVTIPVGSNGVNLATAKWLKNGTTPQDGQLYLCLFDPFTGANLTRSQAGGMLYYGLDASGNVILPHFEVYQYKESQWVRKTNFTARLTKKPTGTKLGQYQFELTASGGGLYGTFNGSQAVFDIKANTLTQDKLAAKSGSSDDKQFTYYLTNVTDTSSLEDLQNNLEVHYKYVPVPSQNIEGTFYDAVKPTWSAPSQLAKGSVLDKTDFEVTKITGNYATITGRDAFAGDSAQIYLGLPDLSSKDFELLITDPLPMIYDGEDKFPTVQLKRKSTKKIIALNPTSFDIVYTNATGAEVKNGNNSTQADFKRVGTYYVRVEATSGNTEYQGKTADIPYQVSATGGSRLVIKAISEQSYENNPQEPADLIAHKVYDATTNRELTAGSDFAIDPDNTSTTDYNVPGLKTITIKGKGKYAYNTVSTTYRVVGDLNRVLDGNYYRITGFNALTPGDTNDLFYDGNGWTDKDGKIFNPGMIGISLKNGSELVRDTDYTISAGDLKHEGPVTITVRANSDDYTGAKEFSFNVRITRNKLKWVMNDTATIDLPYTGSVYTVGEGQLAVKSDAAEWKQTSTDTVTIGGAGSEIKEVGKYNVTIASTTTGGGATTLTVNVLYDLNEAKVYYGASGKLLNGETFTYTGQPYVDMNAVKVRINEKELTVNTDYKITRSYNPAVNTTGSANFSAAGTIEVKLAEVSGKSSYFSVTTHPVTRYTINPINMAIDSNIHINVKSAFKPVYDGKPHQAVSGVDFDVTYTPSGASAQTLVEGKDYSVTIVGEDAECINAGTYTIYIIGQNNFTGQNQKTTYQIEPHSLSTDAQKITIEDMLFAGTGKQLIPSTMKLNLDGKDVTLTKGVDYMVVEADDNDDTNQTGKVKIKGMNNYKDTVGPLEFRIVPIDLANVNVYVKNADYGDIKGEDDLEKGKYVEVYIPFDGDERAVKLVKGVDYALTFRLNGQLPQTYPDKVGTYTVILNALSGSKMVAPNSTYDNKKTLIVHPKNISNAGVFTVNKTPWSASGAKPVVKLDNEVIYENGALKSKYADQYKITVTNADKACGATLDEMLFDKNYTNESQLPTVTIEGIGNYGGTVVKHFQIGDKLKKSDIIIKNGTFKYDGKPHKPTYEVNKLAAGQYVDNLDDLPDGTINAGIREFTVTATGGPLYGSATTEFTIIPDRDSVWGYKLDLPKDPTDGLYYVKYDGTAFKPKVIDVYVLDSKGKKRVISDDEIKSIEYTNNTGVGTGNVKVTLTNYQGNLDATAANKNPMPFKILSVSILDEDYSISLKGGSNRFAYTGKPVTPEVIVTRNSTGKDLVKDGDYVVDYKENTNAGQATVTVTAINNYTGSKVLNFGIYSNFRDEKQTQITIPKQLPVDGEITELKGAEVISGGNTLTRDKEYTLQIYSTDGYQKHGYAVFTPKTEYYIGSKTVAFDIGNDESMYNVLGVANAYTYNHAPQKPVPIVTDKTGNLIAVNTASITYNSTSDGANCINAGYVTMSIPVTNAGSTIKVTRKYNILPKNINAVNISRITSKKYSGSVYTPVLKLVDGSYLLVGSNGTAYNNKTDYAYSYSDNLYPGRARVHIVGTNNYTGTSDIYFNITVNDVATPTVKAKSTSSLKVSWKKVSGISGYRILYTPENGRQQQVKVGSGTTAKTLTGLEKGKTYTVGVQTYVKTSNGRIGYGSVSIVMTATMPGTPKAKVKRVGTRKYKISWKKTTGATGYMVYRKTGKGKWGRIKTITKATTLSYTNTGLKKGTVYTYRVLAYHKVGTKRIYSKFSSAKKIRAK